MTQVIVEWLQNFIHNEYLLLYVMSIIPLTELRGALILTGGMEVSHMLACLASVAGASTSTLVLLLLFRPLMKWLRMTRLFKPVADMIENSVKDRAKDMKNRAENIGEQTKKNDNLIYLALYIFVAIPLPLTGAWSGAMIAAFIGLKYWKSAGAIIAGNLTAGLILTLLMWVAKDYVDVILIAFLCIMGISALILVARKWQKNRQEKVEIGKAEAVVPEEEKPVIGEFAAGGENGKEIIVEILDEDGNPIESEAEKSKKFANNRIVKKIKSKL